LRNVAAQSNDAAAVEAATKALAEGTEAFAAMRMNDSIRKALSGKSIKVRGRVVKFNGGILGRNWIHIQDGTGSPKEGTDDLTVTSDAAATVGSVVTFAGTIAVDKDFGAGYAYPVMLESGAIVAE